MKDETNSDFLKDVLEKQDRESDFFGNKKLTKMMDIFLIVFVIAIICMVSFAPF